MIRKTFSTPFYSLPWTSVTHYLEPAGGTYRKKHSSGWTITGDIDKEIGGVQDFEADHPVYGTVWGSFAREIFADSDAGLTHFIAHHPPVIKVQNL